MSQVKTFALIAPFFPYLLPAFSPPFDLHHCGNLFLDTQFHILIAQICANNYSPPVFAHFNPSSLHFSSRLSFLPSHFSSYLMPLFSNLFLSLIHHQTPIHRSDCYFLLPHDFSQSLCRHPHLSEVLLMS